jgi:hypothetical protein
MFYRDEKEELLNHLRSGRRTVELTRGGGSTLL